MRKGTCNLLGAVCIIQLCLALIAGCASPTSDSNTSSPSTGTQNSDKSITSFKITSPAATGVIDEAKHTILVTLPAGSTVTALTPTISISGSSISPASGVTQDFTAPVVYTVIAADGTKATYTVTITLATASSKAITGFSFGLTGESDTIDEATHKISVVVSGDTSLTALVPTIAITGSSVSPASGASADFSSDKTYTVTAADKSTQAYTVTVTLASVTYFANATTTGTVPVDTTIYKQGYSADVMNGDSLTRANYTFAGWNTKADGSGSTYCYRSSFTMGASRVFLYAIWIPSCLQFTNTRWSPSTITITGNSSSPVGALSIPGGVTAISARAFSTCSSLTSVTIPASVTSIGAVAFYNCSRLASIAVDQANPAYESDSSGVLFNKGKTCLLEAPALLSGSYSVPSTVTSISDDAFSFCSAVTSVSLPEGLTSIGDYAFSNCALLKTINLPSTLSSLGRNSFQDCTELTSIAIPSGITAIGISTFYGCRKLATVSFTSNVTAIEEYAFENCQALKSVDFPTNLRSIGYQSFDGAGFTSLVIPSSVTTIGDSAFYDNIFLSTIYVNATTPPTLGTDNFFGHSHDFVIHVPSASLTAYTNAKNWSDFLKYLTAP